eukprot:CAMPEP_0178370606 /NCGR_PEP_ID=MMETSP0689_2-20121128/396_1 /TAXON_ID=160604 /ORGANISM="Amphidinium massartii, Strain CS-259" /LENGTH=189 /DNA_ID=CAMNT_0019990447 /DNA_START=168 /DNA_END=734 /DNA_ORIENTATION=-
MADSLQLRPVAPVSSLQSQPELFHNADSVARNDGVGCLLNRQVVSKHHVKDDSSQKEACTPHKDSGKAIPVQGLLSLLLAGREDGIEKPYDPEVGTEPYCIEGLCHDSGQNVALHLARAQTREAQERLRKKTPVKDLSKPAFVEMYPLSQEDERKDECNSARDQPPSFKRSTTQLHPQPSSAGRRRQPR